mmetsp:Transcript_87263/g.208740  ORF Transcript_87263/g.208740 Transcript_87263/m.208740 type:complete len:204 (-) Transcript_87263:1157-1768(-)
MPIFLVRTDLNGRCASRNSNGLQIKAVAPGITANSRRVGALWNLPKLREFRPTCIHEGQPVAPEKALVSLPTSLVWAEVQAAGEDPRPRVAVHEGLDAADLAEQVPRHRDQCDVIIHGTEELSQAGLVALLKAFGPHLDEEQLAEAASAHGVAGAPREELHAWPDIACVAELQGGGCGGRRRGAGGRRAGAAGDTGTGRGAAR